MLSCANPQRLQKICDGLSARNRCPAARLAALVAPSLHRGRSPSRLPLRHLNSAGRVLIDPGTRSPAARPPVLRTGDPREPRSGSPARSPTDLQSQDHPQDARAVSDPRRDTGRNAILERLLQKHADQQYHKENRALRAETTINNSYDFGIGKRLCNLPKLREVGFAANRRLLDLEHISHDCILAEDAFQAINGPVAEGRQRASGLRFADPRVQALLHISSCSASWHKASAQTICASIWRPCQAAIRNRSLKPPSPTNCAACVCTA